MVCYWYLLCCKRPKRRFLRAHGLNLYHPQYECLELLSFWVPSLYMYTVIGHQSSAVSRVESVGMRLEDICYCQIFLKSLETMDYNRFPTLCLYPLEHAGLESYDCNGLEHDGHQQLAISHEPSTIGHRNCLPKSKLSPPPLSLSLSLSLYNWATVVVCP